MSADSPVNIGVVGVGYWGKNYVRLCGQHSHTKLLGMCDMHPPTLEKAIARFPDVPSFSSLDDLLAIPDLEAVVVVVPARTSHQINHQTHQNSTNKHTHTHKATHKAMACLELLVLLRKQRGELALEVLLHDVLAEVGTDVLGNVLLPYPADGGKMGRRGWESGEEGG